MDFNLQTAAFGLAVLSIGVIGVILAGSALWPEVAEKYKKNIPTVIIGCIMVSIAGTLIGFFGG